MSNNNVISDINNEKITDTQAISNLLNNYFTNVGPSMGAKISTCPYKDNSNFQVFLIRFNLN